jgi:membrane protease YdiL (CAAX protease family)
VTRAATAIVIAACALVYAGALVTLAQEPGFSLVEPLFVLVVLGGVMSALAWASTRKPAAALVAPPARGPRDVVAVLAYLALFAVLVLGFGFTAVKGAVTTEPAQSIASLVVKLVTMVALPLALLAALGGTWLPALRLERRHVPALVVVGAALLTFQAVFGRGLKTLGELDPSGATLAWAIPACFVWMCVEAGLSEEVLFRVVVQDTLARWMKSNAAAIATASLVFGLAHAPGLFLRGGILMEGVAEPSLAWAIAYSIAVIAPAGLLFGMLWARTRNLLLIVVLHGAMDTLPNLAPFIREWT